MEEKQLQQLIGNLETVVAKQEEATDLQRRIIAKLREIRWEEYRKGDKVNGRDIKNSS